MIDSGLMIADVQFDMARSPRWCLAWLPRDMCISPKSVLPYVASCWREHCSGPLSTSTWLSRIRLGYRSCKMWRLILVHSLCCHSGGVTWTSNKFTLLLRWHHFPGLLTHIIACKPSHHSYRIYCNTFASCLCPNFP